MNYFELYPGDYQRDTGHLTLAEHGAFLLLLCAYYGSEKPIPAQNDALFRITKAMNSAEKKAALSVANQFFPIGEDGLRHNARADAELAKAADRMEASPTDRKASQAERAKRYRDRRSAMFKLLREHGVVLDFNVKAEDLEAAVMELASRNSRDGERDVMRDERDDVRRDVTASRPQTPDPSNTPERSLARTESQAPTETGRACLLMRNAGCAQANPSHPDLLAAIAEGVSPEVLADTVREGLERTPPVAKPFTWAIATARGRRGEGAKPTTTGAPNAAPRRLSAVERVEANIRAAHAAEADPGPPSAVIDGEAKRIAG